MKRLLFVVFLVTTFAYGADDYKVFETHKNINADLIESKETIFLGGYKEYRKNIEEIQKSFLINGAAGITNGLNTTSALLSKGFISEGMQGMGIGLAINMAVTGINWIALQYKEEKIYIKIELLKMKDGTMLKKSKLMVIDNYTSFEKEEAIKILENKD